MKNKSVIFAALAVGNIMFSSLLVRGMTNYVAASSTERSIKVSNEIKDEGFKYIKVTYKLGESEVGKVVLKVLENENYISSNRLDMWFDDSKYTFADESLAGSAYELKNSDKIVVQLKKVPPIDTTKKDLIVLNLEITKAKPNESVNPLFFDFYKYEHRLELPEELIPKGFKVLYQPMTFGDSMDYVSFIVSKDDDEYQFISDPVENIFKPINVVFTNGKGESLNSTKLYEIKDSATVSKETIFGLLKYNSELSEYEIIKNEDVTIKGDTATVPLRKLSPKKINIKFVDEDTNKTIDALSTKVKNSARYISKEQVLGILNDSKFKLSDYHLSKYNDFSIDDNNVSAVKLKKNSTTKPKPEEKYHTTVNFIDQSTKKKITTLNLHGKHGQKYSLIVPEGYDLAENESSEVTIDKSKNNINIKLVKRPKNVTAFRTNVTTHNLSKLYTKDEEVVENRGLAENSDWHVDKKIVIKGQTYYGVSTYEYVKASDVFEYTSINASVTTSDGKIKYLYDSKGKKVNNRALRPNSSWRTDKSTTINGKHAYRVSTNEWLLSDDTV